MSHSAENPKASSMQAKRFVSGKSPGASIKMENSHSAEKNLSEKSQRRSLVCFRGSGRRFCFGRPSDVSSMF